MSARTLYFLYCKNCLRMVIEGSHDMYESNILARLDDNTPVATSYKRLGILADDLYQIFAGEHNIGAWRINVAEREAFWSDEVFQLHGLEPGPGGISLNRVLNLYHPDDAKSLSNLITKAVTLKTGFRFVLRVVRPNGATRLAESIARVQCDENGQVVALFGVFRDVTVEAERDNLKNNQALLIKNIVEKMPSAIAVLDRMMRYVAISDRWLSDYNIRQDIIGKSHYDVFPDTPERWKKLHEVALGGRSVSRDLDLFERASGVKIILNWALVPWHDRRGEIGGIAMLTEVKQVIPAPMGEGMFQRRPALLGASSDINLVSAARG